MTGMANGSLIRAKKPIMWDCSDQPYRETGMEGLKNPHHVVGFLVEEALRVRAFIFHQKRSN
jgi:hypothetical protein